MDASKVHGYMEQFRAIKERGARLSPQQRDLRTKIREAKMLDRVDAEVLVLATETGDGPRWEKYLGVSDYNISGNGELSLLIGGQDADGEWCTAKMVCWPDGRWLKFGTDLTSIPNPYYADPDQPDPDSDDPAPPRGFGSRG